MVSPSFNVIPLQTAFATLIECTTAFFRTSTPLDTADFNKALAKFSVPPFTNCI